jgi:acyl-CoA reductase-like NAD-dependent aldehyde dehydrogenase
LIVDSGVDIDWAASQAALGAYANCGQICTSVERVFVHSDIAEDFCNALTAEADRLNTSSGLGPLVDRRLRDSVDQQVQEAIRSGATLRAGGNVPAGAGSFYPATVLTDCEPSMRIMKEETFGPVAPICVLDDFQRALDCACDDAYGLAATVLTSSMEHAHSAIAALPVGTVKINAVFGGAPGGSAQPRKASGHGFGYGPELLEEMTTTKVVHITAATR